MYKISVETKFAAAHKLLNYEGDCVRIHGHNWVIKAQIAVQKLDSIGIGYDFKKLTQHLNNVIKKFDHQLLNEIPPFDEINPSSENLANYIFHSLKDKLAPDIKMISVEVKESEKYSVIYSDEN